MKPIAPPYSAKAWRVRGLLQRESGEAKPEESALMSNREAGAALREWRALGIDAEIVLDQEAAARWWLERAKGKARW